MTAAFPWEGVQVIIPAVYRFKKDQLTVFIRVRMKNSKNNHICSVPSQIRFANP